MEKNSSNLINKKSLTGHSLGAAGVHEVIYSLLMMKNNFLCGSHNIEEIDPEANNFPILKENEDTKINCFLSNSFGFGGTNGSIVIKKFRKEYLPRTYHCLLQEQMCQNLNLKY